MAHHAAKLSACANCHHAFVEGEPDDFCPRCGQHNQAPDLRLGHVLEEALEGFFHFDGKVWQTLKLLLFRPGELTRRFLAGHRMPYVPPIRLYVFISFVFFFVLSLTVGHQVGHQIGPAKPGNVGISIGSGEPAAAPEASADKEVKLAFGQARDSLAKALASGQGRRPSIIDMEFGGDDDLTEAELARLPHELSDQQLDSVLTSKHQPLTFWNRFGVRRSVRWHGVSQEEIVHQLLRAGSILLFVLMPLAALLLKLAYFRRGRYYLGHLIFTIHAHCFVFLLLLLGLGLSRLLPHWNSFGWGLLLLFGYFVLALRTVYEQSWLKTTAKSLLLGISYGFAFAFAAGTVAALGAAVF